MPVSQLGYLGIGVSDVDRWETFAIDLLGMEVTERADDGTVYLRMDEYHHRIALVPNGTDDMEYVGWQVPNREQYEEIKAKLLDAGVEYSQGTPEQIANRHVSDMITFDLAGLNMEVYIGPQVLFERPFRPGRALNGFKTGDLGLGHVGLNPERPEEFDRVVQVLTECLGFKRSDAGADGTDRFFHCNPREHSAVVSNRAGDKRIGHFMIELNSIDDVGSAYDMADEQGVWITQRLGKHTNDHMISFYMESPSGFGVEYGWGGRLIDDDTWQVTKHDQFSMWGHRRPERPASAEEEQAVRRFLTSPNGPRR